MAQKRKPRYVKKDPIEHILDRPDTWVGSIRNRNMEEYVSYEVDGGQYKIQKQNINMNPALLRIFVEALSNSIDNVQRSKEAGNPCTKIRVTIDKESGETSVWNDGEIVAIEKNNDEDEYNHTMIFGQLMTSSNYDDEEDRMVSGRNGLGIKLTSVYSKSFTVEGVDPENGKKFCQTWTKNMRETTGPTVRSSRGKKGYTHVTWTPDFKRFKLKGYTDDIINLYMRYVCDAAMLTKVDVYFNGTKIPVKNLRDYSLLYHPERISEVLMIPSKSGNVVLTPSNGQFEAISFVNGVYTSQGGVHVESWCETIFRPLVQKFNKTKKTTKKTTAKKKEKGPQINISDVKRFFKLFVNASVINPEFTSQSKTELTAPFVASSIPTKSINALMRWGFVDKVKDIIRAKELLVLKKTEKKTKGYKKVDGLDPANNAGGKQSRLCTLLLTEGLSAKTFAVAGIEKGMNGYIGRDWFGIYPLRGKLLNVRNATTSSIAKNKEITDIIQALGVRYGVDYTIDNNYRKLNYGKVMILTDADCDGIHIKGLILNVFHTLFPTLLQREDCFLNSMQTPIIKVMLRSKDLVFYDDTTYQIYVKKNENKKLNVKYYKGLGTWSSEEIPDVFGSRIVEIVNDENATVNMNKVFHKSRANERKTWLSNYNPNNNLTVQEGVSQVSISDFIDGEMINFSLDDCGRSIPNLMDGMKESHRKILYACFLRKLNYNSKKTLKVAQLAGYVAEHTNYHHGEQNLFETITKMANEFPGSNNIPLLYRDGQFGSRLNGGKDAANARYIFTKLEELTRLIYRPEDDCLLERVVDDGDIVEPKYYVPIIPMILVNGNTGIGTGWSSTVPSYNPLELIECIKIWLENESVYEEEDGETKDDEPKISLLPDLNPWYRDFNGRIEQDPEKPRFITYGNVTRQGNNQVLVDELPIGLWTDKFKETLEGHVENKQIKSIKNYSTPTKVNFVLTESSEGFRCTETNLKLHSYISIANMVLFITDKHTLHKFGCVEDIIDTFCKVRYVYYIKRKVYILKDFRRQLKILNNKARFLQEVRNKELVIFDRDENDIVAEMEENDYDKVDDSFDYLLRLPVRSFTLQKIQGLEQEITKLEATIRDIENTTEKQMWLNDLGEFKTAYEKWMVKINNEKPKKKRKMRAKTLKKK